MPTETDVLQTKAGSITAPAGCGKTHLIAAALRQHDGPLPVLVLTHTNAGVAALQQRFVQLGVKAKSARVSTIDAFSKRLAGRFLKRSGLAPHVLNLEDRRNDYPAIRAAAIHLLRGQHLDDPLASTYARLIVDEYQDCVIEQHHIVSELARSIPTCVLGDPMQAIFGFAGQIVDWNRDVLPTFPSLGTLTIPHRWINANARDLGEWLLEVRGLLERGERLDVRTLPGRVKYIQARADQGDILWKAAMSEAMGGGKVLLLGDSKKPASRHLLASQLPGATVVEPVELADLTNFSRSFDLKKPTAADDVLAFANSVMAGLDFSNTTKRLATLRANRGTKAPSPIETALLQVEEDRSMPSVRSAIDVMRSTKGVRVYRHEILHRCLRAIDAACGGDVTFHEASISERERFRVRGRSLGKRNMGSTLLLKGLEADTAVILRADDMDARNLYVALTRASHHVIVCSTTPILPK